MWCQRGRDMVQKTGRYLRVRGGVGRHCRGSWRVRAGARLLYADTLGAPVRVSFCRRKIRRVIARKAHLLRSESHTMRGDVGTGCSMWVLFHEGWDSSVVRARIAAGPRESCELNTSEGFRSPEHPVWWCRCTGARPARNASEAWMIARLVMQWYCARATASLAVVDTSDTVEIPGGISAMVGRAQGCSSWGDVELSVLVGLDALAPSHPHLKTRAW